MSEVIIVTGASRGIGAACALHAGRRGYKVCVNYLASAKRAEQVVARIRDTGGEAITVQANAAEETDILRLFAETDDKLGPVSALINNAGTTGDVGRLEDIEARVIEDTFRLNVTGPFLCAREAVRRMSTRRGGQGGVIVNISSAAAKLGGANQYLHYAASKAAIETFTMGLGQEVAGEGIRVVGIRPGLIDTEIHAAMGMPDRVEKLGPTVPMGRAGTADEIAETAMWLLSDQASYVTATTIEVTGGR
jgi:NAD(P)-dependent dehydrogenase (short-subunit alcohol dehydrogenase family)